MGVTKTCEELQPSLGKWLARELEARIPAYVERIISLRVDALIAERADESTRRAVVNLPKRSLVLGRRTETIHREIDTRLPREEDRAPLSGFQQSTHTVPERQRAISTGEQWHRRVLISLENIKDGQVRTRPLRDKRKLPYRDEGDPGGYGYSEYEFNNRNVCKKSEKKT